MKCVFCEIVSGNMPCHKVWEDENFLAFLSIFPNTEGVTVIIPKKHYSSYVFDLPRNIRINLIEAAGKVAKLLDSKLDDVGRTAMVFEGFGVDHIHAKLFPMHGTRMEKWQQINSSVDKYSEKYEGYVSSHDSKRANDEYLSKLAKKIQE